jgi:hypothetical protein
VWQHRDRLELRLHPAKFVELHRARDLRFQIIDIALRSTKQRACCARHARQTFGASTMSGTTPINAILERSKSGIVVSSINTRYAFD